MRTSNIDFSKILKRNISVNSTMQNGNILNMYNIARQSLKENKSTVNVDMEKLRKHVLSTMACHSSIRFHRSLTMEEMKQVIVDLQKCE